MSKVVDANELRSYLEYSMGSKIETDRVLSLIDDMEYDAVSIVRCKECKHRYNDICTFHSLQINDEDFCNHGDRE